MVTIVQNGREAIFSSLIKICFPHLFRINSDSVIKAPKYLAKEATYRSKCSVAVRFLPFFSFFFFFKGKCFLGVSLTDELWRSHFWFRAICSISYAKYRVFCLLLLYTRATLSFVNYNWGGKRIAFQCIKNKISYYSSRFCFKPCCILVSSVEW